MKSQKNTSQSSSLFDYSKFSKKAQIQVQFNWIFVMIVGGIILMFFTNIILKQKDISEKKIAVTVINDLETIATGAGISRGTAQILNKPDIDLEFDCRSCNCRYIMKEAGKNFGDKIIFAPKRIIGRDMIAWTQEWSAPFRVTNFLFLTGPQVIYYVIDLSVLQSDLGMYINETLPSTIRREYYDYNALGQGDLIDNNYPQIKVIYVAGDEDQCPDDDTHAGSGAYGNAADYNGMTGWNVERDDISAVCIYDVTEKYEFGGIKFYKPHKKFNYWIPDGEGVQFVGKQSVFAAIFAYGYDNYVCNIQDSLKRMELIAEIYQLRTEELADYNPGCSFLYSTCDNILGTLVAESEELSKDLSGNFEDYYRIQQNLTYYNTQLQIRSCSSIY